MKKKFVGFGELLVRLTPEGYYRFSQTDTLKVNYTGAEGNMAIALSYMGIPSMFVTKLPDSEIGRCAMRKLAQFGVDTSQIVWGGRSDRLVLSGTRGVAAAVKDHLRPEALRNSRSGPFGFRLGRDIRGCWLVPLYGDQSRIERLGRRDKPTSLHRGEGARRESQLRPELP